MHALQNLPTESQLLDLAYYTHFPISGEELIRRAHRKRCSPATIQFLRQFNAHDRFENSVDFVNRCEEVKLFEHELADAPPEYLYSQQD